MRAIVISLLLLCSLSVQAQDRINSIRNELEARAVDHPGLTEPVEISIEDVELQQFLRGLGINHKLNLNVESGLTDPVINNFSNAEVQDVLVFLCKEFDLEIEFIGSIISVKRYAAPYKEPEPLPTRIPMVSYSKASDFLSLDLKNDSLTSVARRITSETLKNVVLAPDVKNEVVSVFIQNRPFDSAIEKLAFSNGLSVRKDEGNFYLIEKVRSDQAVESERRNQYSRGRTSNRSTGNGEMDLVLNEDMISLSAMNTSITQVIHEVSDQLRKNYFLYTRPEGETDLFIENATYEQFLNYILNGSGLTFKQDGEVYLIGELETDILQTTEVIRLENRTVEKISEAIPQDLSEGLTIAEFIDLNALIVSGSYNKISQLEDLVRKLDQPVPTVLIEVLIVDYNKSRSISAGISTGLGSAPESTSGTITPGTNISMNSASINNLINSFNGFGLVNLGNVTPEFHASIEALETSGVLRTRSTPKLSTMNGTEASLSIGRTEYYLEVTNRYIGTENPSLESQQNYKSVNADLSIDIKPTVSGNDEVTLEITVQQSDFTERISESAPPGNVTRNFQSKVRIKDGDMILLGGLESRSKGNSGSGVPFLSRIPVLKWFFGKHTKTNDKTKLNVFIRSSVLH